MQSDSIVYKFYYQWWKNIDKSIFLLISLLFVIGLFFSLVSTSLIASDKLDTNSYFFFFKHLIYHRTKQLLKLLLKMVLKFL